LVVDRSAIRRRFARLERSIAKLRQITEDVSYDDYVGDTFLQDVVEHNLQIASQIVLDVSTHIIAEQGWEAPDSYEQATVILGRHGVIPPTLVERLHGMAGFRNILVHGYLEVDQGIVFTAATDHLEDYELFVAAVIAWLERVESP